jgi:hypothetical protein
MRELQNQLQAIAERIALLFTEMQAQRMEIRTQQMKRRCAISSPVRAIAPACIMGFYLNKSKVGENRYAVQY